MGLTIIIQQEEETCGKWKKKGGEKQFLQIHNGFGTKIWYLGLIFLFFLFFSSLVGSVELHNCNPVFLFSQNIFFSKSHYRLLDSCPLPRWVQSFFFFFKQGGEEPTEKKNSSVCSSWVDSIGGREKMERKDGGETANKHCAM